MTSTPPATWTVSGRWGEYTKLLLESKYPAGLFAGYFAYDQKGGRVDHDPKIFNASSCHHIPEIIGGIEEEKCGKLLTRFFKERR